MNETPRLLIVALTRMTQSFTEVAWQRFIVNLIDP